MLNTWALHHDEQYWPNPEKFNPDRWINSDGQFEYKHFNFLPFSTGRRVCVGESLAKAELFMLTTTMFQKMTFEPADGDTFTQENMADTSGLV